MRIRWSPAAADDLDQIGKYLKEHHPSFARSTLLRLYSAARSLTKFPQRGRLGQLAGTRELVMSPLPYIIVYKREKEIVYIVRLIHGAEDWQ